MPSSKSPRLGRLTARSASRLVRPLVRHLHAYVPGEQPRIQGLIKLNTNESPYPPSPRVLAAIKNAVDDRLRLYPDPTAQGLRNRLARLHRCKPDNVIIGNGSDELLALACRAFVEPQSRSAGKARAATRSKAPCTVQFLTPSYSLYPVLADIHGALRNAVPLHVDFSLPSVAELRRSTNWSFSAALTYITTPNAPSGHGYSTAELEALCRAQRGVVVLDETYADFAQEQALSLATRYPHVLVCRTFSKAYSLCFQRVGYFIGHPALIAAIDKIRDSYNVNGLGQIAALATLDNLSYYRRNFRRIIATRTKVAEALRLLGFGVCPSQANFLLVRPPGYSAETWLAKLRQHRILVRWFAHSSVSDRLRISIGSEREMALFLRACRAIAVQLPRTHTGDS